MVQSNGRGRDYHGVCVVAWSSLKPIFANHVRYWHLADIPTEPLNVRFCG
jgi:hypothetical protein